MNWKTEYGYGLEERLESAQLPGGKTVTYGYDGFNRMIQRKLGNLHTVTYEYETPSSGKTSGRLSRMINGGTALSYTYDAAGNITTIVENGTERVRYLYDELNQLVREDSAVQNKSIEYVYDGGGNLLARKEYAYTTGELGGVMNTVSYGYSGSWKDLLTSYNGTAISYDTIGNPLTWRGGLSFTWQNGRQLSTAQKSGLSLSYQYNASGIRTEKTVNGVTTEYYLDGSSIVAEKTGTDVIWYLYDGMGLAGFELNGTSYYYVYNGQGDVIGILDSSGNRVVTYTYDAWGSPLSVTGSLASTVGQKNPIRYRGYYYDTETGLYYLQSRYYDPAVGRFINADGIIGANKDVLANNIFTYCGNNPINFSDITGKEKKWAQLGFKYDGTAADFHRADQGLPPLAYEMWLYQMTTVMVDKIVQSERHIQTVMKDVTYIPKDKTKDVYIQKSKELIGPSVIDGASLALGAISSIKPIAKKVPYLGPALIVYDSYKLYEGAMDKIDLEAYEEAMNKGEGVLIITWAVEGDPRIHRNSYTKYISWDGKSN